MVPPDQEERSSPSSYSKVDRNMVVLTFSRRDKIRNNLRKITRLDDIMKEVKTMKLELVGGTCKQD